MQLTKRQQEITTGDVNVSQDVLNHVDADSLSSAEWLACNSISCGSCVFYHIRFTLTHLAVPSTIACDSSEYCLQDESWTPVLTPRISPVKTILPPPSNAEVLARLQDTVGEDSGLQVMSCGWHQNAQPAAQFSQLTAEEKRGRAKKRRSTGKRSQLKRERDNGSRPCALAKPAAHCSTRDRRI